MIVQSGQQLGRVTTGTQRIDISAQTLAQLTIKHGREGYSWGQAVMSTAQLTVAVPEGADPYWQLGDVGGYIYVDTGRGPALETAYDPAYDSAHGPRDAQWELRFTGHITDLAYTWETSSDGSRYLAHRVQAVGLLARLGSRLLPWTSFSQQTARARAEQILTQAWSGWVIQTGPAGDFLPTLAAEERQLSNSALTELETLSAWAEAVLWDDTDSTTVWQELGHRNQTQVVDLPSDAIEWAPEYAQRLDMVNDYTLEYGSDQQTVRAQNATSVATNGTWAERAASPYTDQNQALTKAERVIRRQGFPPVLMPGLRIYLNLLNDTTYPAVRSLRLGDKVRLPTLPNPYPAGNLPAQTGGVWIVEGWTETVGSRYEPDLTAEWVLELYLSPPSWSLVGVSWADLDNSQWQQQPADMTWDEIGDL